MKKSFSAIVLAGLLPLCGAAGTLDDAPFHVVVPSGDWKIDEATPKSMSKGVTLLATISNEHAHIKSFIIKETLQPPATNALDQLCGGLSESFTKRNVKKISESDAPFLGYPAKTFAYLIAHGSRRRQRMDDHLCRKT